MFLHVCQNINKGKWQWVTGNLYDTNKDNLIIEHCDMIEEFRKDTKSGRSMIDGPNEIEDLDKTDHNKEIVEAFCDDVLIGRQYNKIADDILNKKCAQHNPDIADGLEGFHTA